MIRRRGGMDRQRGQGGHSGTFVLLALWAGLLGVAVAAPTVTTTSGANTYVERTASGGFLVDSGLTVSSTATLSFCQIHLIEPADTSLTVGDVLDIVISNGLERTAWDANTRSFTVKTPTGTVVSAASYQTVLRKLSFYNPSSNPATNQRTIKYTLVDVNGGQNEATKLVSIQLVDDTPVVALTVATAASYVEGEGHRTLDATISVTDPDSDSLTEGTIQITGGYSVGNDVLHLNQDVTILKAPDSVTPYGLTSNWDVGTGTLTVSGSAPVSVYQDIFRKTTLINSNISPETATRSITFRVRDLSTQSTPAVLTLPFTSVNQLPVLTLRSAASLAYAEGDAPLVLDAALTLTDADDTTLSSVTVTIDEGYKSTDTLSATLFTGVSLSYSAGVGTLSGSGSVAAFEATLRTMAFSSGGEDIGGTRRLRFDVNDGRNSIDPQYRTLVVTTQNDAPIVTGNTTSFTLPGRETMVMTNANVTDADSSVLSQAVLTISSGCNTGDSLVATISMPAGMTGAFAGCAFTITGAGSPSDYTNVLRSMKLFIAAESAQITKTISIVVTDDGGAASTALARTFYATSNLPQPTITGVTSPPTAGGLVTITGTNFGPVNPSVAERVVIGTLQCTSVTVTVENTQITCLAPGGSGAKLNIEVVIAGQKSAAVKLFSFQNPTVTSATSASTAGANTTITGTNFGALGSANLVNSAFGNVTVGGALCTNPTVTVAHTTIVCEVAAGTGPNKDVIVIAAGISSGTTGAGAFDYSVPSISAVTKASFMGHTFTITGTNFGPTGTVATIALKRTDLTTTFSATNVVVTNHTSIVGTVIAATTADLTKTYDVTVTVNTLQGTSAGSFMYEGPVITSITNTSYYGGTATITGRNFGPVSTTSAVTKVTVGTYDITSATTTALSLTVCKPNVTAEHTTICVYLPDYVTTGNSMTPDFTVTITSSVGPQTSPSFSYFAYEGPVITGYTYGSMFGGGVSNGDKVTITGRNFGKPIGGAYDTPTLIMGGTTINSGTVQVISQTQFTTEKTAADILGVPQTAQNVSYTGTLNGQAFTGGTGAFSYIGPTVGTVNAFDTRGGVITVNGDGFGPVGTTFYDTATYPSSYIKVCKDAACSSTETCTGVTVTQNNIKLTCTLAGHAYVGNKITVAPYTAVLTSGTSGEGKVTVSVPTVTTVSSPSTAGGLVTITGTNFGPLGSGYASVLIDGNVCSGTSVTATPATGDSTLTCTAVAGTGRQKNANVTLTNNGKVSAVVNTLFNYGAPVVTSVSAPSTAGGTVTITGSNFGPTGGAKINSVTLNGGAVTLSSVTVAHTTIVGTFATAGTGQGYNAAVNIDGQLSTTNTVFRYATPQVATITTRPSILGGNLVFTGKNFGPTGLTQSQITITVSDAAAGTIPCSQPTVTNHTQMACVITCTTPCSTEARTITLTINTQTNSSTTALLAFEGPVVNPALTADVSLHGSQTVAGLSPLTIVGRNFGKIDGSDNSYLTSVKVCKQDTYAACNAAGAWITATGDPVNGGVPTVTTDYTTIIAWIPGGVGANNTVLVTASGADSGTTGEKAYDYIAPQISFDSTNSITSRAPTAGGLLTVAGVRFGAAGSANVIKVLWNYIDITTAAAATVSAQDTQIVLTTPAGAGSATMSFDISFNGTAEGALSSNVVNVKYTGPLITAVSTVPTSGGTTTITGTSFGPVGSTYLTLLKITNSTGLYHNATSFSVTVANTQIQAVIPGGVGRSLNVEFTLGGQFSTGGAGLFKYAGPTITSVTSLPSGNEAMGVYNSSTYLGYTGTYQAWVTITGSNFGLVGELSSGVTIGEEACNSPRVTVAQTQIQCLLGQGTGANYDVVFRVGDQPLESSTGVGAFRFLSPTITNVTSSNYFGGKTITVIGTNFGCVPNVGSSPTCVLPRFGQTQNITITINGKACIDPLVTVDHTTITCTAPAMLDQANITGLPFILTVQGQSVTTTYDYLPPEIVSVTEGSLFGGMVTITGKNFGPVGSANIAFFSLGGTQQNLTELGATVTVNDTEITFNAPASSGLNLTVLLTIRGQSTGISGNGVFSYVGPRIDSASNPTTAGGTLTITGRNFGPDGSTYVGRVLVNGVECANGVVSTGGTILTCTQAAGSGGDKDISLRINGESDENTGVGKFSYLPPTISAITPMNAGPNENITFSGVSFGTNVDNIRVFIGGLRCENIQLVTPHTAISCITPKLTGTDKQVFVHVDGLISPQGVFSFSAPEITNVTEVVATGGFVNITGKYFGGLGNATLTSVYLGSAACLDPQVIVDETVIRCFAQELKSTDDGGLYSPTDLNANGTMDVTVTVSGNPGVGQDKFAFIMPTVTFIAPRLAGYQDKVTITGNNFGNVGRAVSVIVNSTTSTLVTGHTNFGFIFTMPPVSGFVNNVRVFIYGREVDYTTLTADDRNVVYKAPEINPLRTIPPSTTRGGNVTFVGKYFGPVGAQNIDFVKVRAQGAAADIPCSNPYVTAADTELTCLIAAGSGKDINVNVSISKQHSGNTGNSAFRYARPSITKVQPFAALPANSKIFVTGTNFGPNGESIDYIKFYGPGDEQCGGIHCTSWEMVSPHEQMTCITPVNVGFNLNVIVNIKGQESLAGPGNFFNYTHPTIFNISRADTDGLGASSIVTIHGRGFGPVSDSLGGCFLTYIEGVDVGRDANGELQKCQDPQVVVADTQITCLAAPGAGTDMDAIVYLRGSNTLRTGDKVFSYNPPVVTEVPPIATIGGTLSIMGNNFGPSTDGNVQPPLVEVYSAEVCSLATRVCEQRQRVLCQNPAVVGAGHQMIQCTMPPGTGGNYTVVVTVAGQASGTSGDGQFSYLIPEATKIFPAEQPLGESTTIITITGRNFGDNPYKVNVTVGGRVVDVSLNPIRLFSVRDPFNTPTGESELVFTVPPGAGEGLPVIIIVDGQQSVVKSDVRFSYSAPFITGSTPVSTMGGPTTIFGGNFGPIDIVPDIVLIDGQPCLSPRIKVPDEQIECLAPPGVGKDLDIYIQISADQSKNTLDSGNAMFRYQCPEVNIDGGINANNNPRPSEGSTGQWITITGRNFGNDTSDMSIGVEWPDDYKRYKNVDATLADPYWLVKPGEIETVDGYPTSGGTYKVRFIAPVGFGISLRVRIDVAGQDNIDGCDTEVVRLEPPLYTYAPPQNLKVVATETTGPPSTQGGRITVQGDNLGPLGGGVFDFIAGINYDGAPLFCLQPNVTRDNIQAECFLPPGAGGRLKFRVRMKGGVGGGTGATSLDYNTLSYGLPTITSISPTVAETSDYIIVEGSNLGATVQTLEIRIMDDANRFYRTVPSGQVQMLVPHEKLNISLPLGTGVQRWLQARVPAGYPEYEQASTDSVSKPYFSYAPPVVTSALPVPTQGGVAVIRGDNFGDELEKITSVFVAGQRCTGVNITVPEIEFRCNASRGMGGNYDVTFAVDKQEASGGRGAFSYALPLVGDVLPGIAYPGTEVIIAGVNFGISSADIVVTIGGVPCIQVEVLLEDVRLRCIIGNGAGKNQPVVVEVDGLVNDVRYNFTYQRNGCDDPRAANYDPLATVNDGLCQFLGCTDNTALNFDPLANTMRMNSCIRRPVSVALTYKLDYATYLLDPEPYDLLVEQDVATNANVSVSRVNVTGAVPGSVVFSVDIFDDTDFKATSAARVLEDKIKSSTFDGSASGLTLLSFEQLDAAVIDPNNSVINTKANEPAVSTESIVGLIVGLILLIVWAIYWRQVLTCLAGMCCRRKKKVGVEIVDYKGGKDEEVGLTSPKGQAIARA